MHSGCPFGMGVKQRASKTKGPWISREAFRFTSGRGRRHLCPVQLFQALSELVQARNPSRGRLRI